MIISTLVYCNEEVFPRWFLSNTKLLNKQIYAWKVVYTTVSSNSVGIKSRCREIFIFFARDFLLWIHALFDWQYFWFETNVGDRSCFGFARNFHISLMRYAARKCQFPNDFYWSEIGAVGFELWLMTASSNNFDSYSLKRRHPPREKRRM